MKNIFATLICVSVSVGLACASPVTVFNSLTAADQWDGYTVQNSTWGWSSVYGSFSVFSTDFSLESVDVALLATKPTDGGSLNLGLYTDSGTAPGTLVGSLGTIADASLGTTTSDYDFSLANPLALAPGRYWVGISSVDDSSAAWSMAKDISGAGVLNEYYGDTADGYYANNYSGYPYAFRMDVAGADAPEPSTILLGAFGLALLAAYRRRAVA